MTHCSNCKMPILGTPSHCPGCHIRIAPTPQEQFAKRRCRRCGHRYWRAGAGVTEDSATTSHVIFQGFRAPSPVDLCEDCTELLMGFVAGVPDQAA